MPNPKGQLSASGTSLPKKPNKSATVNISGPQASPSKKLTATEESKQEPFTAADLKRELPNFIKDLRQISIALSKAAAGLPCAFKRCTEKNLALRNSAVCSICSGRNHMFLKAQKLLVSIETCGDFVNTCFDAWTMLIQIMNGMKKARAIAEKIRQVKTDFSFPYKGEFISAINIWLKVTRLESFIKECKGAPANCSAQGKVVVCDSILNVKQPTFVEKNVAIFLKGRENVTSE